MNESFAGAGDATDRRRRRLAQQAMPSTHAAPRIDNDDCPDGPSSRAPVKFRGPDAAVLPRLFSARIPGQAAVSLAVVAIAAAAWHAEFSWASAADRKTSAAFMPPDSLTNVTRGLFLLIAAQLALLIAWIRSGGNADYRGLYRCWKWLAVCLVPAGLVTLAPSLAALPAAAVAALESVTGPIRAARPALQLIPAVLAAGIVLFRVIPDMGRCRATQACFSFAVLVAFLRLMLQHATAGRPVAASTDAALALTSSLAVLLSLQWHSWFVIHVSNDPPVSSRMKRVLHNSECEQVQEPVVLRTTTASEEQSSSLKENTAVSETRSEENTAVKADGKTGGKRRKRPAKSRGTRKAA